MKGLAKRVATKVLALALPALLTGCSGPWNDPYAAGEGGGNVLYSAFTERPKHLDPVQSYAENEAVFTAQIYTPPLQYHYLKRPYELAPLAATRIPVPVYYDAANRRLPDSAPSERVAYSIYEIDIRPGVLYQPHPAFARDENGRYRYHDLPAEALEGIYAIGDFAHTGTRELVADDFAFEIRRLA